MSSYKVEALILNFSLLFFICKLFGIYPQSWQSYRSNKTLQPSKLGTLIVVAAMIVIFCLYNVLIYSFADEDKYIRAQKSTLTFVIGLFLNYIGPVMMVVDQLTAISNQSRIGLLFDRICNVDEKLHKENIAVDNSVIKNRIFIMIAITIVSELSITLATYIFLVDYTKLSSTLWMVSCVPTLYSSLDKIWFSSILYGLKQRFQGINNSLDDLVEEHNRIKHLHLSTSQSQLDPPDLGYRGREILANLRSSKLLPEKSNKIFPLEENITKPINSFTPHKEKTFKSTIESDLCDIGKMEIKLNNLCQLHDEICEIGKNLNELWSYPILILMAYGFLIFTAQLYFLYCGTQGQPIPSLFRSAKSAIITSLFLFYTSGKCVYLIYLSWKTSLESKRTGICLHKCGVAADNNMLYEIVNHLSLKLLNHSVDFSACGFFTLDMETLYGVSGGITSYLIILIQFNLAAQQAKDSGSAFGTNNSITDATNTTALKAYQSEMTFSTTTANSSYY